MITSINLRKKVWVKLTEMGSAVYNEYQDGCHDVGEKWQKAENGDFLEIKLWFLMDIFGSIAEGKTNVFVGNKIHFKKPSGKILNHHKT